MNKCLNLFLVKLHEQPSLEASVCYWFSWMPICADGGYMVYYLPNIRPIRGLRKGDSGSWPCVTLEWRSHRQCNFGPTCKTVAAPPKCAIAKLSLCHYLRPATPDSKTFYHRSIAENLLTPPVSSL